MVPVLTQVFTGNILLLLLYLACTINERSISSAGCLSGSSSVFSGVFIAVGVGDYETRDATTVKRASESCPFHCRSLPLVKS